MLDAAQRGKPIEERLERERTARTKETWLSESVWRLFSPSHFLFFFFSFSFPSFLRVVVSQLHLRCWAKQRGGT